jgi:SAM-dependent methyltransferase
MIRRLLSFCFSTTNPNHDNTEDAMHNTPSYTPEALQEKDGLICEKHAPYGEIFEKKIDQYLDMLGEYEAMCLRPDTDKDRLYKEILTLHDTIIQSCREFEISAQGNPALIKEAQIRFRKRTDRLLLKSYFIAHARTWPLGYQVDYKMLESLYRNVPLSEGIGYYLDRLALSTTLGTGVRDRIGKLRDLLKEELLARQNPKVLDIACGSCREIFELAPEIKAAGAKFTCIDADSDALDFSRDRLSFAGLSPEQVELLRYNALRMFDFETTHAEFGSQDLIYSVGFFDYLPDDFLVKLLNTLSKLLNPGGKLIAAFKDADRYRHQDYHWMVNWDGFLQRTENDFNRLLRNAGIPRSALSMTRIGSGAIVFYVFTKS